MSLISLHHHLEFTKSRIYNHMIYYYFYFLDDLKGVDFVSLHLTKGLNIIAIMMKPSAMLNEMSNSLDILWKVGHSQQVNG